VTQTTVNTAVWTATAPSLLFPVTATDHATVTVVPLTVGLEKTVGLNPNVCAATTSVILPPGGGNVTYCYEVTNTGSFTVTRHDLLDSHLGLILNNFPFTLAPGASAFLTQTAAITFTTTNVATWTVRTDLSPVSANAVVTVTVWVEPLVRLPLIRR
jgi:hypothetical protein